MKKYFAIALMFSLAIATFSCGETEEEKQKRKEEAKKNNPFMALAKLGKSIKDAGKQMEADEMSYQQKLRERQAKGDTIAINYKDLQKYLPASLDGYKAEKPTGGTINATGMSYSNAEIRFKKDNGDYVHVALLDYNAAYGLFTMATSMWNLGMNLETDEEKAGTLKLDNGITGWESIKKKEHNASVVLGIGYRFLLTVDASNQDDTELVKSVAKEIKLDDLAKM